MLCQLISAASAEICARYLNYEQLVNTDTAVHVLQISVIRSCELSPLLDRSLLKLRRFKHHGAILRIAM